MNKLIPTLFGIAVALQTAPLYAHPGHGNWSPWGHEQEHALWLFSAVGATCLLLGFIRSWIEER